jgi:hypothetical protein
MANSLIRGLSAALRLNSSNIKREAKRLQKHSAAVFGQEYPLTTCQAAIARAKGYQSWAELVKVISRFAVDKAMPPWTVQVRSDWHEALLQALYQLRLESNPNGPVLFFGDVLHSLPAALVLFLEEITYSAKPGLILLETKASAVQDSLLGKVASQLDLAPNLEAFTIVDLREQTMPFSISATVENWCRAIIDNLPAELGQRIIKTGWPEEFECLLGHISKQQGWGGDDTHVPFKCVEDTLIKLLYVEDYRELLDDENRTLLEIARRTPTKLSTEDRDTILKTIRPLRDKNFDGGRAMAHYSIHEPMLVLFSREDVGSVILAAVVHSWYFWRYVRERAVKPALYISENGAALSDFVYFGEHSLVVDGLQNIPKDQKERLIYRYGLKVVCSENSITYAGQRIVHQDTLPASSQE